MNHNQISLQSFQIQKIGLDIRRRAVPPRPSPSKKHARGGRLVQHQLICKDDIVWGESAQWSGRDPAPLRRSPPKRAASRRRVRRIRCWRQIRTVCTISLYTCMSVCPAPVIRFGCFLLIFCSLVGLTSENMILSQFINNNGFFSVHTASSMGILQRLVR